MGGLDDHVSIPSPRSFFSSIYNVEAMPRSSAESHSDNRSGIPFGGPSTQVPLRDAIVNNMAANNEMNYETSKSGGGGLMERMVARAGFNAPRLDTENIKPVDFSENQEIWSPYLTIPPGLSPATLLESPIFISNPQILPSPTTGKLFGDANATFFAPQPLTQSGSSVDYGASTKANPYQQSFPNTKVSAQPENPLLPGNMEPWNSGDNGTFFPQTNFSTLSAENKDNSVSSNPRTCYPVGFEQFASLDEPQEVDTDQRSADDGYNWRKYGQKQVKKCEYPRSYYKCTCLDCPVKKKVERSHEGEVTEIIYKGTHNHPKPPPPNCRSTLGTVGEMQPEPPRAVADGDQIWSTMQQTVPPVWRQDNLEMKNDVEPKLSAPISNEALSFQGHGGTRIERGEGVGGSSIVSDDEDEGGTHGSVSLGYDGEEDELESKRRRIETSSPETNGLTRGVKEPRVVVQTVSEVDILEDGYRWRKYGQKVVKGNPNPRSYYKCTSQGCNVRKHIERAAQDPLSVITTYEGRHNHLVPVARNNNNHLNLGTHTPATGPSNVQNTEASQILNRMARSEGPSSLSLFGLRDKPQLGPTFTFGPNPGLGFGYGMNQPMPGLLASRGKLPVLPTCDVRPSFGHLNRIGNRDLMLPKGEQETGPVRDPGLGSSSSSSVYRPNMGRWSRGPQI